ncbi:MAG: UDP-3-O-(3-hydroxymyristoyl)glucosamine N-acyltransferase [Paludibacteraceae bacterium]|nr:UDP-3-O-(3-hydroxymyristoyl)glucosamine N-acyltransferase [Paludibacteraceae bacterium]
MTFTAQQISTLLKGDLQGDPAAEVANVSSIENGLPGTLCFIGEEKYLKYLAQTKASVVLLSRDLEFSGTTAATVIRVDNARGAMAQLLTEVSRMLNPKKQGLEQPCYIADGNILPDDVYIGAFAYIGRNVRLGEGVQIYPDCYVGDNCVIGDNTVLYAGVRVYHHSVIGKDCILHSGVVIGADGFGFEPDKEGVNRKVPQIGNVVIEDDVEIGANSTVDRAMMGSTIIHRNVKIDNLVQIAHNVEIGESTFLCAQVGIAGSTKVGRHCVLAGQVGVAGHIEIADNCVFGAQTGVPGNVRKAGVYQGYPAIDAANWRRSVVGFKNLPELQKIIYELKRKQ